MQYKEHPLGFFHYCPHCGSSDFRVNNVKSKKCGTCGFVYYFNPSSSVGCFIRDGQGRLLVCRRAHEPARGTMDLPGGFVDSFETGEEAAIREIAEETGLKAGDMTYLFSLPNIYPYSGFEVHTLDLFYECRVDSFAGAVAADDVSELIVLEIADLDPEAFGLESVGKAVAMYKNRGF